MPVARKPLNLRAVTVAPAMQTAVGPAT